MNSEIDAGADASAVVVRSDRKTLIASGPDRITWLNGLVTCNLAALGPRRAVYGLATSKVGRILADVIVVADGERLLVSAPPAAVEALQASFERYLVMEDVELSLDSGRLSWLFAHGPDASRVLGAAAEGTGAPVAELDLVGLGGAVLVVPGEAAEKAEERAVAAGARLATGAEWNVLRLERGVPVYGVDFDDKTYPQEASLEKRAVSFDKGCYLGQEVVCRLEMRGHVHRKLASFVLPPAAAVPEPGAEVRAAAGEIIGTVTSAAKSDRLGAPVGFAMVKYAHAEPGTAVRIGEQEATIVAVPLLA
jgi:tRNA-modifying protein YgfZ